MVLELIVLTQPLSAHAAAEHAAAVRPHVALALEANGVLFEHALAGVLCEALATVTNLGRLSRDIGTSDTQYAILTHASQKSHTAPTRPMPVAKVPACFAKQSPVCCMHFDLPQLQHIGRRCTEWQK